MAEGVLGHYAAAAEQGRLSQAEARFGSYRRLIASGEFRFRDR